MTTAHRDREDVAGMLPADLELVPASVIRQQIPETNLWRLEKSGDLPALRIGRRRYYRLSDWRAFLNRAAKAPPISVPWTSRKQERSEKTPHRLSHTSSSNPVT